MFDKKGFDKFILDNKIVGIKEEPIKLVSGRTSHWYVNCRGLSNNFELIDRTAEFVITFLDDKGIKFDYVYGVPAGATKLAVVVNYKIGQKNPAQKIIIGREKPKEHGDPKDKYFVGNLEEGDKVIVFEDVTTTGGSVIKQLEFLKEAKVNVVAVVALVNRLEKRDEGVGVAEYIKKEFGIDYYWLSDGQRLLPLAVKQGNFSKDVVEKVQKNIDEYSTVSIKLGD